MTQHSPASGSPKPERQAGHALGRSAAQEVPSGIRAGCYCTSLTRPFRKVIFRSLYT